MEGSGLEKVFETYYEKIQLPICFLERPFSGDFAVISLSK